MRRQSSYALLKTMAASNYTAAKKFDEAKVALEEKDVEGAERDLRMMLKLAPGNVEAYCRGLKRGKATGEDLLPPELDSFARPARPADATWLVVPRPGPAEAEKRE